MVALANGLRRGLPDWSKHLSKILTKSTNRSRSVKSRGRLLLLLLRPALTPLALEDGCRECCRGWWGEEEEGDLLPGDTSMEKGSGETIDCVCGGSGCPPSAPPPAAAAAIPRPPRQSEEEGGR